MDGWGWVSNKLIWRGACHIHRQGIIVLSMRWSDVDVQACACSLTALCAAGSGSADADDGEGDEGSDCEEEEDAAGAGAGAGEQELWDATVKLLRLMANLCIDDSIGSAVGRRPEAIQVKAPTTHL